MNTLDHPAVAKVSAALVEAGHVAAAEGIRILPSEVRTAVQAAEALGIEVGAIANSLIFRASFPRTDGTHGTEDAPVLALTSGAHRADTDTLAALLGATSVGKADPDFVKRHTGQVIGGVAPVGHLGPIRTLVDTALRDYDVVWAAAGHAKSVFPTTFEDLVTLTGGLAADVASPAGQDVPR
ncbi:aminoacyl-tRNA deacylase [Prauserella marina]|uniref:Cys-tRNA(Pro) deacylase, prolyl-tRNA editing enzyme YbaK/EbsC n=1 Tax=Prauserella marina TaxID=530584 RepID=A0A222VUB4_9PSEU|nr:YbaK/EbsC family protein [Prauserella marina]ASR37526.1 aminoacyl-tRNA deacylase [Prauserella marina]PWV75421.1 prolyl-tRNA editing enzyme YbaK/EbsC (Cys-tRNA(Pro) deacylase) [Prauserella marina]SDD34952.1 Cys-tRNA(Pro) deacylase, prolyl-tRNA editing enzyme YbaK/EbsC [Prauserella marina]